MISLSHLSISYDRSLLKNEVINFYPGQINLICGESGVGKTSLLYRIALLYPNLDYSMQIDNISMNSLNQKELSQIKRERIGYVLQENKIIEHLNVYENLVYFAMLVNKTLDKEEALDLLETVRMDVSLTQDIQSLSLGERQRLAIACVLVKDPDILILDEPTASLDIYNEAIIFQILLKMAHEHHKYVIIASHSQKAKEIADWIYEFKNQRIEIIKEGHKGEVGNKKESMPLSKKFPIHYILKHVQRCKFIHISMIGLIMITVLLSGITSIVLERNKEQEKSVLYNQFDKQFYLTNDERGKYVEQLHAPFQIDKYDNCYPYIKATLQDNSDIEIVPYFDYTQLEDKVMGTFKGINRGIYLSHDAYKVLNNEYDFNSDVMSLFIDLYEFKDDDLNVHTKEYSTQLSGILKKGVQSYYTKKDYKYIYVYYEDLIRMYNQISDSQKYLGYTFIFDDYKQLNDYKQRFENLGYIVNDTFVDIENINLVIETYQNLEIKFMTSIYVINSIFIVLVYLHMLYKRKKEIMLLKLNGISLYDVYKIFIYEFLLEVIIGFFISCLILIFISYTFISYIVPICICFVIQFVMIMMILYIVIRCINVEKELRKA